VSDDLNRLYALLSQLSALPDQGIRLSDCTGRVRWPDRGVYFFFEPGELRRDGTPRVVRVGTHAVSAGSRTRLWQRLRAHRGNRDGRGNHRGSVFRRHVGEALLRRDQATHPSWGMGSSAPE
jgi:hypothetical protein